MRIRGEGGKWYPQTAKNATQQSPALASLRGVGRVCMIFREASCESSGDRRADRQERQHDTPHFLSRIFFSGILSLPIRNRNIGNISLSLITAATATATAVSDMSACLSFFNPRS